jgi:tRNA (guanine-N7-)-methyltransferase
MRRIADFDSPFRLALETVPRGEGGFARWDLAFGGNLPLRVEIGVGNSPFLIEVARAEPQFNYLGFEFAKQRFLKFLRKVHDAGLENIRVMSCEAVEALNVLVAPASVDHFFLNFPDPWPKHRHRKRRLVRDENAVFLSRLLRPGGGLSLRTDDASYAAQMLEVLDACEDLANLSGAGRLAGASRFAFATAYERRFVAEGRRIHYIEYRRVDSGPLGTDST